jgi:sugar lactone lactonase YvrE
MLQTRFRIVRLAIVSAVRIAAALITSTRRRLCLAPTCLSAALLSACGGTNGVVSTTPVSFAPPIGAHPSSASPAPTLAGPSRNLYVVNVSSNGTPTVTIYSQGKLHRTISRGLSGPSDLAFDRAGNLYVANEGCPSIDCYPNQKPSTVTVYAPGSESVRRTITAGLTLPTALAFDGFGNLYVANNGGNTVTVYAPRSKNVLRTISQGVQFPTALAFDNKGNLYVANQGNNGFNTITVYAPGKTTVMRTISHGIFFPVALAFDASENLYVVNCGRCYGGSSGDSVTVYARGSNVLMRTLSDVSTPHALTFDDSGDLYVANLGCPTTRCKKYHEYAHSTVTVYHPGSNTKFRTIREGLRYPIRLAFNELGDLVVLNEGIDVTVYAPGGDTVLRTISQGMNFPVALAFGP